MRWGVESELPNGTVVLCLFSAEDEYKAQEYLSYMHSVGHTNIFNLKPLPEDITVDDLKILFPRRTSIVKQIQDACIPSNTQIHIGEEG